MPISSEKADELRGLISEWAKEQRLLSENQQLIVKIDIIEVPRISVELNNIESRYADIWEKIFSSKLPENTRKMLTHFVGKENIPLEDEPWGSASVFADIHNGAINAYLYANMVLARRGIPWHIKKKKRTYMLCTSQ